MRVSEMRSRYEARLSNAHNALYKAAGGADQLGDQGAVEECHRIMATLSKMMEKSLAGKRWTALPPESDHR